MMRPLSYKEYKKIKAPIPLTELSCFGALSYEFIDYLLENGEIIKAEKNEIIFRSGEESDYFIITLKGKLLFERRNARDSYKLEAKVGEPCGFIGMITLQNRLGTAVMEQPGYILKISSELFSNLHMVMKEEFVIFLMNITRDISRAFHSDRAH